MEEEDMVQSYHEIFDTQNYLTPDSPVSVTTPGTETGSVDSGRTEIGGHPVHDGGVVYYNEGDGRLVSCSPPAAAPCLPISPPSWLRTLSCGNTHSGATVLVLMIQNHLPVFPIIQTLQPGQDYHH